jgi:hypothetical protein
VTKRIFTPAEANRTLPLVRSIVTDILEQARLLRDHEEEGGSPADTETKRIRKDLVGMMRELENLGATFKDWNFEVGLVDFPARIKGRDVLLCWRSDEDAVTWYHDAEEGFAGRQPIPEDLLDD